MGSDFALGLVYGVWKLAYSKRIYLSRRMLRHLKNLDALLDTWLGWTGAVVDER